MIRNIYKRKNIFVVEKKYLQGESNLIELMIFDTKSYKYDSHVYPEHVAKDYVKTHKLAKATYGEFEDAILSASRKVKDVVEKLCDKLTKTIDEKTNAEYRHFAYEYNSGLCPLLTEGILKPLALRLKIDDVISSFELQYYLIKLDDELAEEAYVAMPQELASNNVLNALIEQDYCECVVKAKKYVFEPDLLSELDDEDKPENEVTPDEVTPEA